MRKKEQVDPPLFLWRAMEEPYRALISFFFKISAFTTAVRYSRVGLGNSRYDHKNKDFDTMVSELEALINALNISQSFLLVGHSYGGLIIRSYAKKHPEKIAGLLFDDATFEDYFEKLLPHEKDAETLELKGHEEVLKKYPSKARDDEFQSLWKVWHSPANWQKWFEPIPSVPTMVLTSTQISDSPLRTTPLLMDARYSSHGRWVKNKPFSMQIGVTNVGHFIHKDTPNLFVDSARMLINVIRGIK